MADIFEYLSKICLSIICCAFGLYSAPDKKKEEEEEEEEKKKNKRTIKVSKSCSLVLKCY